MNVKNVVITVVLSLVVMAGVSVLLFRMGQTPQDEGQVVYEGVQGESRHVKGEGDVIITEFSDFQCPACKSAEAGVAQLMEKYDGKVRLVYRHLPLTSIHPNAQLAAQASEAAHLQDKFWDYHGLLFEKQTEWSEESDPSELFIGYASELGLDTEKFASDMNSKEVEDYVNSESLEASRMGLSSTPSFFVNGERVNLSDIDKKLETLTTSGE